jgi:hypothetical protein
MLHPERIITVTVTPLLIEAAKVHHLKREYRFACAQVDGHDVYVETSDVLGSLPADTVEGTVQNNKPYLEYS